MIKQLLIFYILICHISLFSMFRSMNWKLIEQSKQFTFDYNHGKNKIHANARRFLPREHYRLGSTKKDSVLTYFRNLLSIKNNDIFHGKEIIREENKFKQDLHSSFAKLQAALFHALNSKNPCIKIIKGLLEQGAPLNAVIVPEDGDTALHIALKNDNEEIASFLIQQGADPNIKNKKNETALWLACLQNMSLNIMELLLEKGAQHISDATLGLSPLHITLLRRNYQASEFLLNYMNNTNDINHKNDRGYTALWLACELDAPLNLIELLLKKGSEHIGDGTFNRSPLHTVVVLEKPNIEIVKLLLKYGAPINVVSKDGYTPLHIAISNNSYEIAKLLLEYTNDAHINIQDFNGRTALWFACYYGMPIDLINVLLQKGAQQISDSISGATPLHAVFMQKNLNLETIKILFNYGALANEVTKKGNTPLNVALMKNDAEIATFLLEQTNEAYVNIQNVEGKTALWLACYHNMPLSIIKTLLEKGAQQIADFDFGYSPLHVVLTQKKPHLEIVKLLLDKGAFVNAISKDGRTPLSIAAQAKNHEAIDLLVKYGGYYKID